MTRNYGERWVRYAASKSGPNYHLAFLAIAALVFLRSTLGEGGESYWFAFAWILIALLFFERWHFSRIIARHEHSGPLEESRA